MTEKKQRLTTKQKRFIDEYLVDNNGTQAAIRAGYSKRNARQQADENLSKPYIKAIIDQRLEELANTCDISALKVLQRLVDMMEMDVKDIFNDDFQSIKAVKDWPKIWRQSVSGIESRDLFETKDGEQEMIGFLNRVKLPDRTKIIELIGKHKAIRCWDKDINVIGDGIEMHLHYG